MLRQNWPDHNGIGQFADIPDGENVEAYAVCARAPGQLLGVWAGHRRAFVYPTPRFDRMGKLRPDVAELLAILPSDQVRAGWRRTL